MKKINKACAVIGGGLRGMIPATYGAHIEERSGKRMNQIFKFFSGTSVGSIVCAMWAAGIDAMHVKNIIFHEGPEAFREKGWWEKFRDPNKAKYHRKYLYHMINRELKSAKVIYMKDFPVHIAIATFGLYANRTHYICSWMERYKNLKAADVIAWSGLSAVHYFGKMCVPDFVWENRYQEHEQVQWYQGEVFQDGGQGTHNCTAADTLLTALYSLGWRKGTENINHILSLGCGSQKLMAHTYEEVANDGWARQLINYMSQARNESTRDQVHTANYIQWQTYGNHKHFFHLDPLITSKLDKLDGKNFMPQYRDIAENTKNQIPQIFLQEN